jgi:hypothetical protein
MHNHIKELEKALNAGNIALAKRYAAKIREQLFCMKCKEPVFMERIRADDYFKGVKHEDC